MTLSSIHEDILYYITVIIRSYYILSYHNVCATMIKNATKPTGGVNNSWSLCSHTLSGRRINNQVK